MNRIKRDSLPIALFVLVYIIMSYPLVFQLGEILPFHNGDTYTALWNNWWLWEAIQTGQDIYHTPLLFAPDGLDRTLLPPRYTALPIWASLFTLFGEPIAYNLSLSIEIIIKAYGMYLFGLWLFKQRIPAWTMGAFYAFGVLSLQIALQQPLTGSTEWIPFFMLAYVYGIHQIRDSVNLKKIAFMMILAGVLYSLSVYTNLKIGIFAMLLGGGYLVFVVVYDRLWKLRQFWIGIGVFVLTVLLVCMPLLLPIVVSEDLNDAISLSDREQFFDTLLFVKHRLDRPLVYSRSIGALNNDLVWPLSTHERVPTVGIVAIVFAMLGILYAIRRDRRVFGWVLIAVVFGILSLGPAVKFNYETVIDTAPAAIFQNTIILGVLRNPQRFGLIFWFAFAVLIGYGLHYRLQGLSITRTQFVLIVIAVAMLLYNTSVFPIPYRNYGKPDYIEILDDLPDGAIVDLPMGRASAKYYMAIQIYHRRPIVEGVIARTPEGTYDYIESIDTLALLQDGISDSEVDVIRDAWGQSAQQLFDDGFRYIVIHKYLWAAHADVITADLYYDTLVDFPILYEDDEVVIYDIEMLLS